MLRYLLDTNTVIYVLKRRPIEVLNTFNQHADALAISSITLAELHFGVEHSERVADNRRRVDDFVSRLSVLDYGAKAAAHYGHIRHALSHKGRLIGDNDLHIAAHARSDGLVLVTNNLREFERVEGLLLENWVGGQAGSAP